MARRGKTRLNRRWEREEREDDMRVSSIDLDAVKRRYGAAPAAKEDEPSDGFDGERPRRTVAESDIELDVFGEEQELKGKKSQLLWAITFAALVLVTLIAALYFVLLIDRIEVTGNEELERGEVLTIAGINVGEHLWLADVNGARERLSQSTAIREAVVKRVYPDAISISIVERKPSAAIIGAGSAAIVDDRGYVMEILPEYPSGLVYVYGLSGSGLQAGQNVGDYSNISGNTLTKILEALSEQGIMDIIESIDMSQPLSISMKTSYGYAVHIGQPENIEEKLQNLAKVIEKVRSLGYQGGTIDVGVLGGPVYAPEKTAAPDETDDANGGAGQDTTQTAPPTQTPAVTPQNTPTQTPKPSQAPILGGEGGDQSFSG